MYNITDYTYKKAKELNVDIKPSINKSKKIDVFKYGKKICSIGDIKYSDYPTYINKKGLEYANKRRNLYEIRHANDINKIESKGYYAYKLLW